MQKVAAYILERRDGMEEPDVRTAEAERLKTRIQEWLSSKGASSLGPAGTYQPEDGSTGTFSIEEAVDSDRKWWMLQLHEDTDEGRRFSVAVSITSGAHSVSVYVTLETGWTTTRVMPVSVDPRCPRIVRSLLSLPGSWHHGSSTLHQRRIMSGFEDGEALVAEIQHADRTVPLVVVSTHERGVVIPELDSKLEYDLMGLANVVRLDEDASWALTDILGREWCCYRGAVRLFWPNFSLNQDRYLHPLWTAERLRTGAFSPIEIRDRFRLQLRGLIFRAAALSVMRPLEIDDIRDASTRRTVTDLRQRATSLEEYKALADSYAADNDQLRAERSSLRSHVDELQTQVARLEGDRQALQAHLRAAKPMPDATGESTDIPPSAHADEDEPAEPSAGETHFYKKVGARPTHDVLVRASDCGCNKWQNAHGADKARKGIVKLENGRNDWKNMQHCGSCTGGGMWKVRW